MQRQKILYGTHNQDNALDIIEGNKVISLFMEDYSVHHFKENSTYFETLNYHNSWDCLMEVILKIKKQIYRDGYTIFSLNHNAFIRIGNACYDADLNEAWRGCVRWCERFYACDNIKIQTEEDKLIVNPHAVQRFQERIMHFPDGFITRILSEDYLYQIHKEKGSGRFKIKGFDALAVIQDNIVRTVVESESELENLPRKNTIDEFLRNYKRKQAS